MLDERRIAGSFRDPSGHVHDLNGRILRTVTDHAAAEYEALRDSGLLRSMVDLGWLIASDEVGRDALGTADEAVRHVVEHPRIPHVSFPYEWPFSLLRDAALHHLDMHMAALDKGATLSDASAYNIQFRGPKPIFIDLLSLRRYREGEYWAAHRQFCEQFLNPLLLRALLGIAHNSWFRGTLEGIPTTELARLLPLRRNLSWNVLVHVTLQAKLQRGAVSGGEGRAARMTRDRPLSRTAFRAMLTQLRNWIARLHPADSGRTEWGDYAETNTYSSDEEQAKRRFVADFVAADRPATVWDLGCNTGEYSEVALTGGAGRVIGFDADQTALERACHRARSRNLDLLPLYLDAANPSPDQGWMQAERPGFAARTNADALIALAFEHHLAIGRNIPLPQVVNWLTSLAPTGVIEFVEKTDPTIQRMLALREDIFTEYGVAEFETALSRNAKIIKSETISASGRRLYLYDRRGA